VDDREIALSAVQSAALSAILSIHSRREIDPDYFDALRAAVENAAAFFRHRPPAPPALLTELTSAAHIRRNEATAFPGREPACSNMADWLAGQAEELARL
jgi:hypothetical protein